MIFFIIVYLLVSPFLCSLYGKTPFKNKKNTKNITCTKTRTPHVAGAFYEEDATKLSDQLIKCFAQSHDSKITFDMHHNDCLMLVVPHAGYVYSGSIAATAYATIQNNDYKVVVLIGPSHKNYFRGFSFVDNDCWQTPLGLVPIDTSGIQFLKNSIKKNTKDDLIASPNFHEKEHCLEVQIPFLQFILPEEFKIIPILVSEDFDTPILAKALYELKQLYKEDMIIIISTDMSHYYSDAESKIMDNQAIQDILNQDIEQYKKNLENKKTELCGKTAMLAGLEFAQYYQDAYHFILLDQGNSSAASKDKNSVVGYTSFAYCRNNKHKEAHTHHHKHDKHEKHDKPKTEKPNKQNTKKEPTVFQANIIDKNEEKKLLSWLRACLESYFTKSSCPLDSANSALLEKKIPAFVTLRTQDGTLRGCIGTFDYTKTLRENLKQAGIDAMINDSRFKPVTISELPHLTLEISLLSPMEAEKDPKNIVVGKHGVRLVNPASSAVYLPEVAVEMGWNRIQFLESLAGDKAGLDKNAYKSPNTQLFVFTTQHFSE